MAAAADVPIVRYRPNAKARKTRLRKNNLHDFTIEIRPFGGFCFYTVVPFMHRNVSNEFLLHFLCFYFIGLSD